MEDPPETQRRGIPRFARDDTVYKDKKELLHQGNSSFCV